MYFFQDPAIQKTRIAVITGTSAVPRSATTTMNASIRYGDQGLT